MKRSKSVRFIIVDWANNRLWPTSTFETFEDGWAHIYEAFEHLDDDAAETEYGELSVIEETDHE